jgi:hypothetical protein
MWRMLMLILSNALIVQIAKVSVEEGAQEYVYESL